MKLLIGIPSNRDWKPKFAQDLLRLIMHLSQKQIEMMVYPLDQVSSLSWGRQNILNQAKSENFTHILCIDDDMSFKPEAFDLMLSRGKSIISANYCRKIPGSVTDQNLVKTNLEYLDWAPVFSSNKTGIEEIGAAGFGFLLIQVKDIAHIDPPHFEVRWNGTQYVTEDYFFCALMRKNKVKIFVDHDASRYVWHIGDFPYQERF